MGYDNILVDHWQDVHPLDDYIFKALILKKNTFFVHMSSHSNAFKEQKRCMIIKQ